MAMELKSHLKGLSSFVLPLLFLAACQNNSRPLKKILTEESYAQYQKIDDSLKKEFEQSVWYFYMYQGSNFTIQCNTRKDANLKQFDFREAKLEINEIKLNPTENKYTFWFNVNDTFGCYGYKGMPGFQWKNGWPVEISGSTPDYLDTTGLKQRTKDYALIVQEKFKDGPLKQWLLENKPFK